MDIPTLLSRADARWHPAAACGHSGPDPYYNQPRTSPACDHCRAAEPCLWAGLALEQLLGYRYGTWGGTGPARRERIAASLPVDVDLVAWYASLVDQWAADRQPVETATA